MKKLFILSFLLVTSLSTTHVFAQKCDLDKDEIDPYTKTHVKSSKIVFGNMMKKWIFLMEKSDDKYYVTLNMAEIGEFHNKATTETKLLISLENGKVIEMPVDADVLPSVQIVGSNINTQWLIKCDATMEKMKMLAESPIAGMRITMSGKDFNAPDFKSKQSSRVMKTAECLLQQDSPIK